MQFTSNARPRRPLVKDDPFDVEMAFSDNCDGDTLNRLIHAFGNYVVKLGLTDGTHVDFVIGYIDQRDDKYLSGTWLTGWEFDENTGGPASPAEYPIEHVKRIFIY